VAESHESFEDAVWWAFLRLTDPGYLGDDEGVWRRILSTIFTVLGYVLFLGSLVAIITSWLNQRIRWLEQGLSPVEYKNHIVILGWTNRTLPIMAELFLSEGRVSRFLLHRGSRRLRVVILAEEVGPEIIQQIKDHSFLQMEMQDITLRSGQPIDYEHLLRVNAREAAAIVIPANRDASQELLNPDVRTVKALLTLQEQTADLDDKDRPYIVAEIQEETKHAAAQKAYEGPMQILSSDITIGRLTAQILRHPELSIIYHQLLSQNEHSNIFVRAIPGGKLQTLGDWRNAFTQAIVMGGVRKTSAGFIPFFNGADETPLDEGDRLILLARSARAVSEWSNHLTGRSAPSPKTKARSVLACKEVAHPQRVKLLVLGWNAYVPQLMQSLSTHRQLTYRIEIAAMRSLDNEMKELRRMLPANHQMDIRQAKADFTRSVEMEGLQPEGYDKILLAGTARLSSEEEMDARTLVGLTMLKQVLAAHDAQPQIVVQLADPANSPLLDRFEVDRILSPLVLSHLMAQVALRPELHSIYQELFSMTGAEIVLQPPSTFNIVAGDYTYRQLAEKIEMNHCTLLGVLCPRRPEAPAIPFWVPASRRDRIRLSGLHKLVLLRGDDGDVTK
jgi:hypothetical protein